MPPWRGSRVSPARSPFREDPERVQGTELPVDKTDRSGWGRSAAAATIHRASPAGRSPGPGLQPSSGRAEAAPRAPGDTRLRHPGPPSRRRPHKRSPHLPGSSPAPPSPGADAGTLTFDRRGIASTHARTRSAAPHPAPSTGPGTRGRLGRMEPAELRAVQADGPSARAAAEEPEPARKSRTSSPARLPPSGPQRTASRIVPNPEESTGRTVARGAWR